MKQLADSNIQKDLFRLEIMFSSISTIRQTSVSVRGKQKLDTSYKRPFAILQKVRQVAYKLQLPAGSKVLSTFHVSQLQENTCSDYIADAPYSEDFSMHL